MQFKNQKKLSDQQQIDIYQNLDWDSNMQQIADDYNVAVNQIRKIFYQKIEDNKHDKKFSVGSYRRIDFYFTENLVNTDIMYDPSELKDEELEIFNSL